MMIFVAAEIASLIIAWGDLIAMAQSMFLLLTNISMCGKYFTFRFKGHLLDDMFDTVHAKSFISLDETELKIMTNGRILSNRLKHFFFGFVQTNSSILVLMPIVFGVRTLPVPLYFGLDLNDNSKSKSIERI